MRYFTRQRHQECQDDVGVEEDNRQRERRLEMAAHDWNAANRRYNEYLASVIGKLPGTLRDLANTSLHDALIVSVVKQRSSVEIILNTEHSLLLSDYKTVRLLFDEVVYYSGLENCVGQSWLYEELFLDNAVYEFNALLEKTEITIRFGKLAVRRSA